MSDPGGALLVTGMPRTATSWVGKMLEACELAADELAERGVSATVWDPRVVKPLDPINAGTVTLTIGSGV